LTRRTTGPRAIGVCFRATRRAADVPAERVDCVASAPFICGKWAAEYRDGDPTVRKATSTTISSTTAIPATRRRDSRLTHAQEGGSPKRDDDEGDEGDEGDDDDDDLHDGDRDS